MTSLDMLSGGERSLVGIAALFAMVSVSPPPFLVLDEIDAPLDERNARRFGEMLKDFSKRTQFIVVTHNRATMEAADILYGVTLAEDGTSKVVSLKLESVAAMTSEAASGTAKYERRSRRVRWFARTAWGAGTNSGNRCGCGPALVEAGAIVRERIATRPARTHRTANAESVVKSNPATFYLARKDVNIHVINSDVRAQSNSGPRQGRVKRFKKFSISLTIWVDILGP